MTKNVTLWMDVPVDQRVTVADIKKIWRYDDELYFRNYRSYLKMWRLIRILEDPSQGCRAAVGHRTGSRRWWPCGSGLWSDSTYFCYHHRSGDDIPIEKPLPWWKRIKLQSPVKWGSDDSVNLPG
jgi:hypothetical protein